MEQPAQQEPVHPETLREILQKYGTGRLDGFTAAVKEAIALTHPQAREWVNLTTEEILEIGRELGKTCIIRKNPNIDFDYAKAVSDKLKEKNYAGN